MIRKYETVRAATRRLCEPLETEDYVVQSMPDVSPTKWHLAHTTWFFETFVLLPQGEAPFDPAYRYLFNSYYNAVGDQYPRARRGLMTRPTVAEVWRYRADVDGRMARLLERGCDDAQRATIELGLNHEQQHQELMLTDIKHVLAESPSSPVYAPRREQPTAPVALDFVAHDGGIHEFGHRGDGFCFDNERPRHRHLLPAFALATRLVTSAEYRAFIDDGGYHKPALWLSEGWDWVRRESISAPLYWRGRDALFTLAGERDHDAAEPVAHVSLYEADAYARWAKCRLPREQELEHAAASGDHVTHANFVESGALHTQPARGSGMQQLFGDAWTWTQSAYAPYPGYRTPEGALGEYNGKFMCNQYVLRGGSCATPRSHMRPSYRNFFPASARWQFTSIRLAKDC
jgi:ergothioneine biosynthesis protein EgtB